MKEILQPTLRDRNISIMMIWPFATGDQKTFWCTIFWWDFDHNNGWGWYKYAYVGGFADNDVRVQIERTLV